MEAETAEMVLAEDPVASFFAVETVGNTPQAQACLHGARCSMGCGASTPVHGPVGGPAYPQQAHYGGAQQQWQAPRVCGQCGTALPFPPPNFCPGARKRLRRPARAVCSDLALQGFLDAYDLLDA